MIVTSNRDTAEWLAIFADVLLAQSFEALAVAPVGVRATVPPGPPLAPALDGVGASPAGSQVLNDLADALEHTLRAPASG